MMSDRKDRPTESAHAENDQQQQVAKNWIESGKGKGRIVPRSSPDGATVPKLLAQVSHSDLEHGELPGDPPPRYDARIIDGWVPYFNVDVPQKAYVALNTVWEHKPVLLRNSSIVKCGWSFEDLGQPGQTPIPKGGEGSKVEVLCSSQKHNRFIEIDTSKNLAVIPYYVREAETQRLTMAPKEFVECTRLWNTRRLMFKATVMTHREGTAPTPIEGPLGSIASRLHRCIDWDWVSSLRASQGFGPVLRVDLEAGTAGGLQPARYSGSDELLVQLAGRRRVLLISPEQAFTGMFPFPVAHPYDRYSMVDLENLDLGRWPGCTGVRGVLAVLRPGDVLHVPAYWFAHVQDLDSENTALRFTLHPGVRAPARDAAPLRLSRALEERVAAVEGPGGVRRWLRLIGAGKEVDCLDLKTVAGYRRASMCQGVRDEVEETLGVGAWAELLPAMCRGRLMPTPWLNRDFREPMLLADRPVRIEDTRSEEERKYPQLFRKKLEAEGWSVPPSISTVPVPGVNMPL